MSRRRCCTWVPPFCGLVTLGLLLSLSPALESRQPPAAGSQTPSAHDKEMAELQKQIEEMQKKLDALKKAGADQPGGQSMADTVLLPADWVKQFKWRCIG